MKEYTHEQLKQMMEDNGGNLDLKGAQNITFPEGLTVGGDLYLRGAQTTKEIHYKKLKDGDYEPGKYLFADGILTHVKRCRIWGAYSLYIGKIKGRNVVSDGTHYAHCGKLRDGIADLLFKTTAARGAEQYRGYALDQAVSYEEAVTMYRIITGACRQGTQRFVDGLSEVKEAYTVREMLEMTAGQYGAARFQAFFETA